MNALSPHPQPPRHKSTPFPAKKTGYFPQHCSAFCNAAGLPSLFHPFTIFICPAFIPIRPSSTAPALSQGFSPLLNPPHLSNCSRSLRQPFSLILIQIRANLLIHLLMVPVQQLHIPLRHNLPVNYLQV